MSAELFSGLVKGLGGSLGEGYRQKAAEDHQAKMDEMHLAMSALMNDKSLPGSAKRLGLSKVFEITGVKPPEGLIDSIVPDYQVESGQYEAESAPSYRAHAPTLQQGISEIPMGPASLGGQNRIPQSGVAPGEQPQTQGWKGVTSPPNQSGSRFPGLGQSQNQGSGLAPMPRNPMTDPPMPIEPTGQQSSAPVTQKYTSGMGQADELDRKIVEAQQKLRHGKIIMRSSLDMSPQQIEDARTSRLRDEDQLRQVDLNNLSGLQNQKTSLDTFAREQQMRQADTLSSIPAELQAKVKAVESINGPMTSEEKKKFLGINMTPQEQERYLEAQDIEDSNNSSLPQPQRAAAGQRVLSRNLQMEGRIASIRNLNSETTKRLMDTNGGRELTSSQMNVLIKRSLAQAGGEFGQKESDTYKQQRTAYWSDWFDKAKSGQTVAGQDATAMQWLSLLEKNPQAKANAVGAKVEEDLKQYKQNMAQAIANAYVQNPGKMVYTMHALRRSAEAVRANGKDPNAFWDAIKANQNVVILDDNLEPWNPNQ